MSMGAPPRGCAAPVRWDRSVIAASCMGSPPRACCSGCGEGPASRVLTRGAGFTLDGLRQFRQFGSKTPGHPEVHHTQGVEVTTGPLGQGFGNGVGMGIAERYLRGRFGADACDHFTFVIASDGDLEEGVSHEAGSLAGHLGLGRLVYVYDDNHTSIDGPTELSYNDDAGKRFEAYGWHLARIGEVTNDTEAWQAA